MKSPIKYRLYNNWLEVRMGKDEEWKQVRRTNAKKVTPITQRFGNDFIWDSKKWNAHPEWDDKWFYKEVIGGLEGHNGIDMKAPTGTCLYAPEDGEITTVNNTGNKTIRMKGEYHHVFYHLMEINVEVGNKIKEGELIGFTDNTGLYTAGPHLHWGVYPEDYDGANGYAGYINQLPLVDLDVYLLPYKDGMFLQRTEANGEVYEVIEGELQYCDVHTNPATDRNHLIHKVLRLLKDGIEPNSIQSISEKDFNKFNNLIK